MCALYRQNSVLPDRVYSIQVSIYLELVVANNTLTSVAHIDIACR